jgi:predicted permease
MIEADQRAVSPHYMQTMRMRLLRGRFFDERDEGGSPLVAIVDSSLATRVWPDLDPIGRRIAVDAVRNTDPPVMRWRTVVGVVQHVRQEGLDAAGREQLYMPVGQRLDTAPAFVLRTAGDPAPLIPAIRSGIAAVDKDLPLYDVRTMEEVVGRAVQPRSWIATLLALLAMLALALAAAGTYGVMAYAVERRVHEVGVRVALGAGRAQVLRLFLRRGLLLTALGEAAGMVLALGLTRAMAGLVVGVSTIDPPSLVAAAAVLATSAFLAVYLPARRATRFDPLAALREP